jgi:hypothetical protein
VFLTFQAAWLSSKVKHAHSAARLFTAVTTAWGASAAADLLLGVLERLAGKPHFLTEVMLVGWRQAQRAQLPTHTQLDRLQRLVVEPLASSSRQQQRVLSSQDRSLRLRLPLALLLNQAGKGKGGPGAQGPQETAASGTSLAAQMADLTLGQNSSQTDAIIAAAQRSSIREVAGLLGAVPTSKLPAALLVAAQAAGSRGNTYLLRASLQQLAALDWQAAASNKGGVAPLGALVRAAAAPPPAPAATSAAAASTTGSVSRSGAGAPSGTQQQHQQGGSVSGAGFCLYRALLDSWQAVPQMVGHELAAQVVAAVEAARAQADEAV